MCRCGDVRVRAQCTRVEVIASHFEAQAATTVITAVGRQNEGKVEGRGARVIQSLELG